MSRSEHLELRLHHVESNAFKKNEHISNKCKRDPSPGSWGGIAWHALAIQTSLDRAQYISCSVHQHYCSDPVGHSCQNSMPSLSIAPRPQLGRAVLSTDVNLLMFSRSCIVLYILHWFPHWTEKNNSTWNLWAKNILFQSTTVQSDCKTWRPETLFHQHWARVRKQFCNPKEQSWTLSPRPSKMQKARLAGGHPSEPCNMQPATGCEMRGRWTSTATPTTSHQRFFAILCILPKGPKG